MFYYLKKRGGGISNRLFWGVLIGFRYPLVLGDDRRIIAVNRTVLEMLSGVYTSCNRILKRSRRSGADIA